MIEDTFGLGWTAAARVSADQADVPEPGKACPTRTVLDQQQDHSQEATHLDEAI